MNETLSRTRLKWRAFLLKADSVNNEKKEVRTDKREIRYTMHANT